MQTQRALLARVAPEAGLLLGAGRAILLQLAHPQVGRAIAEHSDFAANPLSRLLHTLGYIYAVSNGSDSQRQTMIKHVNSAHAHVRGTRDRTGAAPAYSALDPRLQLWVAATLYDSARVIAAQVLPQGTCADLADGEEQLYRQYARLGDTLQMPTELWPADISAFERYTTTTRAQLRVEPRIRELADDLFAARKAPWWLRVLMPWMRDVTIAQLPDEVRQLYGYALTDRVRRRNRCIVTATRIGSRLLPVWVRHAPMRLMLRHVDSLASRAARAAA